MSEGVVPQSLTNTAMPGAGSLARAFVAGLPGQTHPQSD